MSPALPTHTTVTLTMSLRVYLGDTFGSGVSQTQVVIYHGLSPTLYYVRRPVLWPDSLGIPVGDDYPAACRIAKGMAKPAQVAVAQAYLRHIAPPPDYIKVGARLWFANPPYDGAQWVRVTAVQGHAITVTGPPIGTFTVSPAFLFPKKPKSRKTVSLKGNK